jgi:hypothetical protein
LAGNAYAEDTTLRALERSGSSFRIGMTTLVVSGLLAAGVAVSSAAAAIEDPALETLWEQFPLDEERNAPSARDRLSDSGRAEVEPAPVSRAASVQTVGSDEADETPGLAILATGIALLIVGIGAAFARARHARHRPAGATKPAGSKNRRLRAAGNTDPPPAARHDTEQYVQLLSGDAAARRRKEVHMPRSTEGPEQAASSESLKATPGVKAPKKAKTSAQFEAEVLKRKPAADAQILEAKGEREAVVLKEKLAFAQEQKQEVMPREQPVWARERSEQAKRKQALPVPAREDAQPKAGAGSERGKAGGLLACEVRWRPVDMTSQFLAVERSAEGAGSTIGASLPFDWRERDPPPESPAAATALAGLIDVLLSEGWVVAGRGEEWFAVRLLLPESASRAKAGRLFPSQAGD